MPIQLGMIVEHGFDEPLALLSDCHRRIERFLNLLKAVAEQGGDGPLNDEQRRAVETAMKYFREAAPRHTEDEEQSLFPRLRASYHPAAAAALAAMQSLHKDHEVAAAAHERVEILYRQWLDAGSLDQPNRENLQQTLNQLAELYRPHIALEDSSLFPLAAQALSDEDIEQLGREMAERRHIPYRNPLRTGNAEMNIKHTLDVRTIPGPQRHPLIFKTFESLAPGEALELINDHNPIPLRNQFNMLKAGQFSWGYLQEGPELFRIRIANSAQRPNPKTTNGQESEFYS